MPDLKIEAEGGRTEEDPCGIVCDPTDVIAWRKAASDRVFSIESLSDVMDSDELQALANLREYLAMVPGVGSAESWLSPSNSVELSQRVMMIANGIADRVDARRRNEIVPDIDPGKPPEKPPEGKVDWPDWFDKWIDALPKIGDFGIFAKLKGLLPWVAVGAAGYLFVVSAPARKAIKKARRK